MAFKQPFIGTKGPNGYQENIPMPLRHHQQSESWRRNMMDLYFDVVHAKFWPYHPIVATIIETHQIRKTFLSNLLSSNERWTVPWQPYLLQVSTSFACGAPLLNSSVVKSDCSSFCCLSIRLNMAGYFPPTSFIIKGFPLTEWTLTGISFFADPSL